MYDINDQTYDVVRTYIQSARKGGKAWDEIPSPATKDVAKWIALQIREQYWPPTLDTERWKKIKEALQTIEAEQQVIAEGNEIESDEAMLVEGADGIDNGYEVPRGLGSSWQAYKKLLETREWNKDSTAELESATLRTLRCLKRRTSDKAVKGLIIGHVQSGKTANMAGLMAMAADYGFNLFIVLSGTIETLRLQTQDRLLEDLNKARTNVQWCGLQHLSKSSPNTAMLSQLHFDDTDRRRYFTVSLKVGKRLSGLLGWLQTDRPSLQKMRILIIDDEADQASIDTSPEGAKERSKINSAIVKLTCVKAGAVNYIGYTATPQANVLNEAPNRKPQDPPNLYPSNFIYALKSSNEYFGPRQIFGIDGVVAADGMDIIRSIGQVDLDAVKSLHDGDAVPLPQSLTNAVAWFLCCCATRRYLKQAGPTTMLVHTSQKQNHHEKIAGAIGDWLRNARRTDMLKLCEEVWDCETKKFSYSSFDRQYPSYGNASVQKSYPAFKVIRNHIGDLLSNIAPIMINDKGDPEHHQGIHLCIDNCAMNGVKADREHIRLLYPKGEQTTSRAFIVVGGATLSRGLTLVGLTSTFFLRDSSLGDSLMQMGRWFGYRKGYELLPRIWMTDDTREKFRFLAGVEADLREELKSYEEAGKKPSDFGPRVKVHPMISWLRLTSKKKMKEAVPAEFDFSGITNQTIIFRSDKTWLEGNLEKAKGFLENLRKGNAPECVRNCLIWRDVAFARVSALLTALEYHPRARVFSQIKPFVEWYKGAVAESKFTNWNVIVAGTGMAGKQIAACPQTDRWTVAGTSVGKVTRTRLQTFSDDSFSIGSLVSPKDRVADCRRATPTPAAGFWSEKAIAEARKAAGLEMTPQLLLYCIDQNSRPESSEGVSNERAALDTCVDVLGVCIHVPGTREGTSLVRKVQVRIDKGLEEIADV